MTQMAVFEVVVVREAPLPNRELRVMAATVEDALSQARSLVKPKEFIWGVSFKHWLDSYPVPVE